VSRSADDVPIVLLVEDNETIRDAFSILLEESGYRMLQAGTGAEALRQVEQERPHLILLDLGLPDMDGLDVARTLKADEATHDIPIVALTGRALDDDAAACRAAGCVAHLAKPVNTRELLQQLPGLMRR
jgi:CheY-like chemotaxis protein